MKLDRLNHIGVATLLIADSVTSFRLCEQSEAIPSGTRGILDCRRDCIASQ